MKLFLFLIRHWSDQLWNAFHFVSFHWIFCAGSLLCRCRKLLMPLESLQELKTPVYSEEHPRDPSSEILKKVSRSALPLLVDSLTSLRLERWIFVVSPTCVLTRQTECLTWVSSRKSGISSSRSVQIVKCWCGAQLGQKRFNSRRVISSTKVISTLTFDLLTSQPTTIFSR